MGLRLYSFIRLLSKSNKKPASLEGVSRADENQILPNMISTTLLEVNLISGKYEELISELSFKECLTILGILNEKIYCAAVNAKVITKCKEGRIFHREKITKLLTEAVTVVTPVTYLATYLKMYWPNLAYHSRTAVARLREVLSEKFKLFTLEERDWSNPEARHRAPNPCGSFDFLGALLVAKLLEARVMVWYKLEDLRLDFTQPLGNCNYPLVRDESQSLPAHKGYTMVKLYNFLFEGIDRWRRDEVDFGGQQPIPETVQAIKVRYQTLLAEEAFTAALESDPNRDPTEVLETEVFEFTEPVICESDGIAILTERVIAAIPLSRLVRRAMKVVPKARLPIPSQEASVRVPCWALSESSKALAWWQRRIENSGLWLSALAPSWVLDEIVPF